MLFDLFLRVLLYCDLLELRRRNLRTLQLRNLGLAHLLSQLFQLFVYVAVLRLQLQNLFQAAVRLYFTFLHN